MSAPVVIFVEGDEDYRFMRQYLCHLRFGSALFYGDLMKSGFAEPGAIDEAKIALAVMRGIDNLTSGNLRASMGKINLWAGKILVVADADNYAGGHRQDVSAKMPQGWDSSCLFLMPDGKSTGVLENLLEKISVDGKVYECFEEYKKCLRRKDKNFALPDAKAKIYAYCEAHRGALKKNKGNKKKERDYSDKKYWDLESKALLPLQEFLLNHLPPPK